MRNQPKPLDAAENNQQARMTAKLSPLVGTDKVVEIHYVKRDGNVSASRGPVAFFNGAPGMDTGSVTIADDVKGNRTVNLHRIFEVIL